MPVEVAHELREPEVQREAFAAQSLVDLADGWRRAVERGRVESAVALKRFGEYVLDDRGGQFGWEVE